MVTLPAFLLGVWHFLIINRQDNSVGKATFEEWHVSGSTKNAKKTFISKIGESITHNITLIPFVNDSVETIEFEVIPEMQEEFFANQDEASATDSSATSQSIHASELKCQQNSLVVNMGGSNNSIGNIIMNQTVIKGKEEA